MKNNNKLKFLLKLIMAISVIYITINIMLVFRTHIGNLDIITKGGYDNFLLEKKQFLEGKSVDNLKAIIAAKSFESSTYIVETLVISVIIGFMAVVTMKILTSQKISKTFNILIYYVVNFLITFTILYLICQTKIFGIMTFPYISTFMLTPGELVIGYNLMFLAGMGLMILYNAINNKDANKLYKEK